MDEIVKIDEPVLIRKPSKHTIEYYLKTLSNGHKVLDFDKLYRSPFTFTIIMTERGALGKTLGLKELIRKRYQQTGYRSMYLMNTIAQVEAARDDWQEDIRKPFVQKEIGAEGVDFWNSTISSGNIKDNKGAVVYKDGDKEVPQEIVTSLIPLSRAEHLKGARKIHEIVVYDELNVGLSPKQVMLWDSLIHTMENVVNKKAKPPKFFILGNNKSLSVPLIYAMGVTYIEDEITEFYTQEGLPLILVISPQYTQDQRDDIEKENVDNPIYQLSKQMGTHKHSYFNESLYDDMNSIRIYTNTQERADRLFPIMSVHHKKQYYNVYRIREGYDEAGKYHIVNVKKAKTMKHTLYAFQRYDVIESCGFNRRYVRQFHKVIQQDFITFENTTTRDLFLSSIK